MLLELGVHGSLVGHSERRQYFGETDDDGAPRAQAALEAGLRVIACVGETLEVREAGEMKLVLKPPGRRDRRRRDARRLVIAYEPVWAIGTGRPRRRSRPQEAHAFIKVCSTCPSCTAAR